jgi:hypothetical protein
MAEVDAVASALATGGNPNNPQAPTQHNPTAAAQDWGTAVPDEFKEVVKAKGWKAPADAIKSYVELEKYSSKAVQDMSAEEKDKLLKRLGRPESPDGLELGSVSLPEGLPRSPTADKELQQVVWEMQALPLKQQAKHIHEWAARKAAASFSAAKQAQEKQLSDADSALRSAWGVSYDANSANVDKLLKLGGDEFVQFMNAGPGKNPAVRKGLYAISKLLTDETLVSGKVPPPMDRNSTPGMVVDFTKSPELTGSNRYGTR